MSVTVDGSAQESVSGRGAVTRGRLLAAAEDVFGDIGYSAASPSDVTATAGIGRTTFYEHFTDMEDLLAALVEDRLPSVSAAMLDAIKRDASYRDQLGELAERMIEFSVTDHVLGIALHQDLPTLGPAAQARIAAAHRNLSEEFGRIYHSGVQAGEFRPLPPDLAAGLLRDTILSAAKVLMRGTDPKQRLGQVTSETVGFIVRGLDPA